MNELTLVLEASGKETLSSRELFDASPRGVVAKMADARTGDTKIFFNKPAAWAEDGSRIRAMIDGRFALASPD